MDNSFLDSFKKSSNSLMSAMNEAIKLTDIKAKLFTLDVAILDRIRESNSNDYVSIAQLYNEKNYLLSEIDQTVTLMNMSVVTSISVLISMLEVALEAPSRINEITICQKQMKAILEFVKKEYLKKEISLIDIAQELLLFIVKYDNMRQKEQYNMIISQMLELYSIAIKTTMNVPK